MEEYNHFRTIGDAVAQALPGDTLGTLSLVFDHFNFYFANFCSHVAELSDGHYWQNSDLIIDKPLRFVGDENNPSNVVIELGGTVVWSAQGGYLEGITWRRPKISSVKQGCTLLRISKGGRVDMIQTVLDNEGSNGIVVYASGPGRKGTWVNSVLQNGSVGLLLKHNSQLNLTKVSDASNSYLLGSALLIACVGVCFQCVVRRTSTAGIECREGSQLEMMHCVVEPYFDLILADSSTARIDDKAFSKNTYQQPLHHPSQPTP
jgi:hypothetical protein